MFEPSAPHVFTPADVRRFLRFSSDASVVFSGDGPNAVTIPPERVYDLLTPTMFGLLEDLTPGSPLMAEFLEEWEQVQRLLAAPEVHGPDTYGEWVYYPTDSSLVRYAPRRWHRIAMTVRNATLLSPPGAPHDWLAGRAVFDDAVIAVAGCSVGSNVLHTTTLLLRPGHLKVADSKSYHLNNANRVRLTYRDLNRNKARVCAEQVQSLDPFIGVSVFDAGIDSENVSSFLLGDGSRENPRTTIVVEETDDPLTKLLLREGARRARLPLVMVTDIAHVASVDVRRFDVDPTLPLVPGVADEEVRRRVEAFDRDPSRERMVAVACAFSGRDEILGDPAFRDIIERRVAIPFAGVPQLGSTAAIAGGLAAGAIARVLLGVPVPERLVVDPVNARVEQKGALL